MATVIDDNLRRRIADQLAPHFKGDFIGPDHPDYPKRSVVWNAMVAKNTVEVDTQRARQNLRLVELLEDLDDVQRVTANFDIPEEIFAEVAG